MPTYDLACGECGHTESRRLTFSDYDAVRAGTVQMPCQACQAALQLVFNPGAVSFIMKDGESGGWTSKALRENKYRMARREVMAKRERDHVFKNKLQPNYRGEETGTWREAQEQARKDKGSEAATTYTPLVAREKTGT